MSTFSKGDTVRCTHGAPEDGLFAGRNYEAKAVYVATHGDAYVDVGVHPDGWNASRFEKVEPEDTDDELADWERALLADAEPEPLKEGDAVLVWAKVVDPEQDELGDFAIDVMYGATFDRTFARIDAIVRPSAGQVPPWVKPVEEPTADYAIIRDGFRTLVRLPEDQRGVDEGSRPWVVVGSNIVCAWDDIEEPVIVSGGAS